MRKIMTLALLMLSLSSVMAEEEKGMTFPISAISYKNSDGDGYTGWEPINMELKNDCNGKFTLESDPPMIFKLVDVVRAEPDHLY